MGSQWQQDKRWADQFTPGIKRELGECFITEAPVEIDQHEATDLLVFHIRPFTVGVRIRDAKHFVRRCHKTEQRWRDQITIRQSRPSGVATEFAKIMQGWGDYFFYGWGRGHDKRIICYNILDLKSFRYWIFQETARGRQPWVTMRNHDGSSDFAVFHLKDIPQQAVCHAYIDEEIAREELLALKRETIQAAVAFFIGDPHQISMLNDGDA
jgi:hypothetical protein